jgi:hypothetical protein
MGEPGNETILNPNHIVRVTKSIENNKPRMCILTVDGSITKLSYHDEADYLKNIIVLRQLMEKA